MLFPLEIVRDFVLHMLRFHNGGEDAVAAQPEEHSRWILISLLTAGIVILFLAYMCLLIYGYSFTVCMTFGAVSALIINIFGIAIADFRGAFEEDEPFLGSRISCSSYSYLFNYFLRSVT
jgi:hypothetical protein